MTDRIAILGWGSLLWDERPEFDKKHEAWLEDGPTLPLEFSRISGGGRLGALTLVIDPVNGQECRVAYAMSKRRDPRDAVCDLRSREGTVLDRIGCIRAEDETVSKDQIHLALSRWAVAAKIKIVVWTALPSNFADKKNGIPFSVENAIAHLRALDPKAKAMAAEYIWRAPPFVNTPLRRALQAAPWF